jgi:hypothetical protein
VLLAVLFDCFLHFAWPHVCIHDLFRKSPAQGQVQVSWNFSPWMGSKTGLFEVHPLEARGLRATDRGGTSDPFVVVHCENRKRGENRVKVGQTEVVNRTVTPKVLHHHLSMSLALLQIYIKVFILVLVLYKGYIFSLENSCFDSYGFSGRMPASRGK